MPIRHCQKCGLKVLIDESQAGSSPFYCQRCTTSLKNGGGESAPGTARREATGKPGTVRVQCPYCKASFNGRIPQKPARGACPVCQKELILLPTGDIRSAAGFDPIKWQREQQAAQEEAPPVEAPATEPEAAAAASGSDVQMPSWMDEGAGTPAPPAEEAPAPEAPPEPPPEIPSEAPPEAPMPEAAAEAVIKSIEPMPEEPPSAPEAPPPEAPAPEPAPEEPPPPPAEEAPPPPPPPPRRAAIPPTARKPGAPPPPVSARGTARRGAVDITAPHPTGAGLAVVAFFLMIVPVVACPILYNGRGGLKGPIGKIGENFSRGFLNLYQKLSPPSSWKPPAGGPPPEKKAETVTEEKAKPGPEDQKRDEEQMSKLAGEILVLEKRLKQDLLVATEEQKAELKKVEEEVKKKRDHLNELRELYKKTYEKDYDPFKE